MTHPLKSSTLKVPGAKIYYEVQGSGPMLLIIPGGPQDAGVFADVRGISPIATPSSPTTRAATRAAPSTATPEELQLDVQADDAAALIEALGDGPAYVFGTSGGAQIGLNLAARHPEQVRALVAHEPPTMMLLDDPSEALAADQALYDTYRRDGVDAAMAKFLPATACDGAEQETRRRSSRCRPRRLETFARVSGNFEYWLAHGMIPLSLYRPDVEALRAGKPRIVVGIGEQSAGQPIYEWGWRWPKSSEPSRSSFSR